MSVLPVWIPGSLDPSAAKRTCQNLPGACDTSLESSQQKKLMHEKKNPASRVRAPAVRENVLRSLQWQSQNDFLELRTIKIK